MEEVAINPTTELPELKQDWEIDSWRVLKEPCVHQDPGEKQWPQKRLTQITRECPGVSTCLQWRRGGWWPDAGVEELNVAVRAWRLLKEVTNIFITSTIVWFAQSCPALRYRVDYSLQAPTSMGFSRQEYWSGLSFLSPVDLPHPGIEPGSPAL